jgi:hypothetical protein
MEIKNKLRGFKNDRKLYGSLGGLRMKIRFDRMESGKTNPNASGKTYPVYRIFGEALEGQMIGQEKSYQIFVTAKEMVAQVKALNKGDIVNVRLKKNGKWWNPTAFEKVEEDPVQTGSTNGQVQVDDRLENLKVAVKVLGPKTPKKNAAEYMLDAASVADMVQDYRDKKGPFQFDEATSDGIPAEDTPAEDTPAEDPF